MPHPSHRKPLGKPHEKHAGHQPHSKQPVPVQRIREVRPRHEKPASRLTHIQERAFRTALVRANLNPQEGQLIELLFDFNRGHLRTSEDVATKMNLTPDAYEKINRSAFEKLRKSSDFQRLWVELFSRK